MMNGGQPSPAYSGMSLFQNKGDASSFHLKTVFLYNMCFHGDQTRLWLKKRSNEQFGRQEARGKT